MEAPCYLPKRSLLMGARRWGMGARRQKDIGLSLRGSPCGDHYQCHVTPRGPALKQQPSSQEQGQHLERKGVKNKNRHHFPGLTFFPFIATVLYSKGLHYASYAVRMVNQLELKPSEFEELLHSSVWGLGLRGCGHQ